jgi:hypothetical protein
MAVGPTDGMWPQGSQRSDLSSTSAELRRIRLRVIMDELGPTPCRMPDRRLTAPAGAEGESAADQQCGDLRSEIGTGTPQIPRNEFPMTNIPDTENSLVLRTDFSDDAAWESLCTAIEQPVGEFRAYVDFLNDPQYEGVTVEQLRSLIHRGSNHTFIFLVDRIALTHADHPILVVDLWDEPGRTFRVIPSQMWGVENNLSIANMDFMEFADAVDDDGVFREFPSS